MTRIQAEQTPFKMLGLDFSVNGFWAWLVWLCFFAGGVFYLWLTRRSTIRRGRTVWQLLKAGSAQSNAGFMADSLPLWIRPLPRRERWTAVLCRRAKSDAAMDPLGDLCVCLLVVCLGIAGHVVWMGVVSSSLLHIASGVEAQPIVHGALLCTVCGFILSLAFTWPQAPMPEAPADRMQQPELLGRRAWILTAVCGLAVSAIYARRPRNFISRSLLRMPRFRISLSRPLKKARHSRRPKYPSIRLDAGFYVGDDLVIHYAPDHTNVRSLALADRAAVEPFKGNFDIHSLQKVHPRALIPFVREGVRRNLEPKPRGTSNKPSDPSSADYQKAYDLVGAAIEKESEKRKRAGKLPNLQLYDLLLDVARQSKLPNLKKQASNAAGKQDPQSVSVANGARAKTLPSLKEAALALQQHRSQRTDAVPTVYRRRLKRLEAFQRSRFGS